MSAKPVGESGTTDEGPRATKERRGKQLTQAVRLVCKPVTLVIVLYNSPQMPDRKVRNEGVALDDQTMSSFQRRL